MILLWSCRLTETRQLFRLMVATALFWGALPTLSVHAETLMVPSASLRSYYDSNVYRRPTQLLPPGTQVNDFVNTLGAGVALLHRTRDIEAAMKMGGSFNTYVVNTNRNYFGATLNGHVGLDHWIDQYLRGAKLGIAENLRYTPVPPSFVQGVRDLPEDVSLTTGVQAFRANTLYNTTDVKGAYPVSRDLSVEGGYTFVLRRIGRAQGGALQGVTLFFDTMAHTWFGGPRYRLARNDSVALLYKQTFIIQSRAQGGGGNFNTNLITVSGDYTKDFQEWSFRIEGGMTFAEPAGEAFPSGILEVTTKPERDTVVIFALSRQGRPSFFLQGGAMISNVARLGISHRLSERLMLDGSFNFGYNEYFPNTDRKLQNLTASSRLTYKLTRTITGEIFYLYQNIDADAASLKYQYSRNNVGFMLTVAWE